MHDFFQMYNDHRLSTERNRTPNQLWTVGMMDPYNPLTSGDVDAEIFDAEFYGEDPTGPVVPGDGDNNVVVSPISISHGQELMDMVNQAIDVNRPSSQLGMDVYCEALDVILTSRHSL